MVGWVDGCGWVWMDVDGCRWVDGCGWLDGWMGGWVDEVRWGMKYGRDWEID